MAFRVHNFTDNNDMRITKQLGPFDVVEYARDLSVTSANAASAFFDAQMGVRRKQLVAKLNDSGCVVQAGAMQWVLGQVEATTGVKGAGDLIGKMFRGAVTGESAIKPVYQGSGLVVLEPTTKHLILVDLNQWGGAIVVEDGMFLACEAHIQHQAIPKANVSSAALGGEGLFNLGLAGAGIVALESPVPEEELIYVDLDNDVLRIDGSLAVAWSQSLQFTVERSGKSLMGSMSSGEGLVNVYRGSGRVMMSPVADTARTH